MHVVYIIIVYRSNTVFNMHHLLYVSVSINSAVTCLMKPLLIARCIPTMRNGLIRSGVTHLNMFTAMHIHMHSEFVY